MTNETEGMERERLARRCDARAVRAESEAADCLHDGEIGLLARPDYLAEAAAWRTIARILRSPIQPTAAQLVLTLRPEGWFDQHGYEWVLANDRAEPTAAASEALEALERLADHHCWHSGVCECAKVEEELKATIRRALRAPAQPVALTDRFYCPACGHPVQSHGPHGCAVDGGCKYACDYLRWVTEAAQPVDGGELLDEILAICDFHYRNEPPRHETMHALAVEIPHIIDRLRSLRSSEPVATFTKNAKDAGFRMTSGPSIGYLPPGPYAIYPAGPNKPAGDV